MIARAIAVLQTRGLAGVAQSVKRRFVPERRRSFSILKPLIKGQAGLEIGGPTAMFRCDGVMPIYGAIGRLDNGNFSDRTIWEGAIREGDTFQYDDRHAPGRQFIVEATDLGAIPSQHYDVVLSSHTLEHTANPIKALREWMRVVRANGVLLLVVPHKEGTFDHRRPVTTLAHLIQDERDETSERDLTHLAEILECHDLALDPPAGDAAAFKLRAERNFENRCLHHHVFDTNLAVEVVNYLGLQVLAVEPALPHHIIMIVRKPAGETPDNRQFVGPTASYRASSPFALDRLVRG